MNEEEYNSLMMDRARADNQNLQFSLANQGVHENNDPGIIKEQLSLLEELEIIDNLLESKELVYNKDTNTNEWVKPTDEDKIVLSPFGVFHFRQIITGYLNKNKLLSNYEEETILDKMKDIATTINDDIFNMFEDVFHKPSNAWCYAKVKERIKEEIELEKFTYELSLLPYDQEEKTKLYLEKIKGELSQRIEEVRRESMKKKIKKMNFLIRFLQDAIHDTYNRAYQGQERRSLRQTMTVTEAKGGFSMGQIPQKKSGFGWSPFNRR